MIEPSASAARRNRWAVSFADLLLLLLGFFVLLQASGSRRDSLLTQVTRQFGGRSMASGVEWRAAELFTPGEAMLTPAGRARIVSLAQAWGGRGATIEIRSRGTDRAEQRFDAWDLAAARLGAVARAFRAAGVPQERLLIRGLDQDGGRDGEGQMIRIAERHAARR